MLMYSVKILETNVAMHRNKIIEIVNGYIIIFDIKRHFNIHLIPIMAFHTFFLDSKTSTTSSILIN